MTNHWVDIKNTDLVLIMGGNAAEAHPCGFKWVTEAMEHRKAKLVVVDPRFTRSAAVADVYAPVRVGTDIAFLGGLVNYLLSNNKFHADYVKDYTNASFLIKEGFDFKDGLFSGYDEGKRTYDRSTWSYEIGKDGYAVVDESMQDPRCVFQQLKKHYSRYTPEMVEKICGTPKASFLKIAEMIGGTATPDRVMTILYALGWTQHSVGSQNIRTMAIIQLLLGNMGRNGGGVNALRGHANVQGITDMCAYSEVLPGYLSAPTDADDTREKYLAARTPKPLRPGSMNFPANFPKWHTSLMKTWYGDAATKENDFAYDYVPKRDGAYDVLADLRAHAPGSHERPARAGLQSAGRTAEQEEARHGTGEAQVHGHHRSAEDRDGGVLEGLRRVQQRQVGGDQDRGLPPAVVVLRRGGRLVHQLRPHGAVEVACAPSPPGEGKIDSEIVAALFLKIREMYQKDGGKVADPVLKLTWGYSNPAKPAPEELLREINGRALADVLAPPDPKDPKAPPRVLARAGEQLPGFGILQADGTTACGNWIYSGVWTQAGNNSARRDTNDPAGLGNYQNWGFSWPANRRVLYNRAGASPEGKPWDAKRSGIRWNGTAWAGNDVPDINPALGPDSGAGPFIMTPEGVARLFSLGLLVEGPFPEHYEPFETPLAENPLHPGQKNAISNPVARVFKGDMESFGKADKFPYAATTYRLTEHHHYWTKNAESNAIIQPSQFVEIGEELAKEKGIGNGQMVRVTSNRGEIKAAAVVTKRIKALDVAGKKVHTVGIPIHWGFIGVAKNGFLANTLTPYVADANSQTPEYKAFLVNIEKA